MKVIRVIQQYWYYFRTGVTYYLIFVLTLGTFVSTVYFDTIRNIFQLSVLINSFIMFILLILGGGIPLAIIIGWAHFKKTGAFQSEQEVITLANQYNYKLPQGHQRLVYTPSSIWQIKMILKLLNNEKPNQQDLDEGKKLIESMEKLAEGGSVGK